MKPRRLVSLEVVSIFAIALEERKRRLERRDNEANRRGAAERRSEVVDWSSIDYQTHAKQTPGRRESLEPKRLRV
jgi:hypothetical protein